MTRSPQIRSTPSTLAWIMITRDHHPERRGGRRNITQLRLPKSTAFGCAFSHHGGSLPHLRVASRRVSGCQGVRDPKKGMTQRGGVGAGRAPHTGPPIPGAAPPARSADVSARGVPAAGLGARGCPRRADKPKTAMPGDPGGLGGRAPRPPHTPCGPARPPEAGPKSHREPWERLGALGGKREVTLGSGRPKGAAHRPRPPDAAHTHNESQRPEVCQHLHFRDRAPLPGPSRSAGRLASRCPSAGSPATQASGVQMGWSFVLHAGSS